MPIFDFKCENKSCGLIFEGFVTSGVKTLKCPRCGSQARRIFTATTVNLANEDVPWIRSILEVVDKESDKPETIEFLRNPTRSNYKRWMKAEGLRHLEPGEKPQKPKIDLDKIKERVFKKYRERTRIEI